MGKAAQPRALKDNEAMAYGRTIRTSPRKLNLVAQMIRGKKAADALVRLAFDKHRIAREVYKILQSAVANAENNHQLDVDRLVVAEASVGKAFVIKRFHARARGRGAPIEKPFSNLRLIVREVEEVKKIRKPAAKKQKTAAKNEPKNETQNEQRKEA